MAANLDFAEMPSPASSGVAAMFYTGETPWHGLGQRLDNPATSAEAIAAARLDWTTALEPMYLASGREVTLKRAVVRSDNGAVLGVVGTKYRSVQNADAFGFMDALVGPDSIRYHTAGALSGGERVWMLAKFDGDIRIKGSDDITEKYILLSNSHDGQSTLRVFYTPIRVVCQNTLNAALRGFSHAQGMAIRHTQSIDEKLAQAREVLGVAEAYFAKFTDAAETMASVKLNRLAVLSYYKSVVPMPADPEKNKRAADLVSETHATLLDLFDNGRGADIPETRHTLWAAYNSVTEMVDHAPLKATRVKSLEEARNNRLASVWFGMGAQLKARAFEEAMAVVR